MNCYVINCNNSTFKCKKNNIKVQFFRIPKEEPLKTDWIQACGQDPSTPVKLHHRVCSDHFSLTDYRVTGANRGLLNTAVPRTCFGLNTSNVTHTLTLPRNISNALIHIGSDVLNIT